VAVSAVALTASTAFYGIRGDISLALVGAPKDSPVAITAGLLFWIVITILTSALSVKMPRGILVAVSTAPIIAAMNLGGPAAAGIVALIGTTEWREVRGRIPWYGSLANHAGLALPAIAGGVLTYEFQKLSPDLAVDLFATILGASFYFVLNLVLSSALIAVRRGTPLRELEVSDLSGFAVSLAALAPLGWLMGRIYLTPGVGWWMTLLFGLPLFTTRTAYQRFAEMREVFTQTIGALAEAVDKRDPYTSKHSQRVRLISVDIGHELHVSAAELEALEWGGLLHDVGKIGVPDSVLLKQGKLTRDERITMNAHPVLGAQIIGPVDRLAPELPVIRHHHEWYNGSGYPDRLMGDEIPRLARILHVADAFEAMTATRPYRPALPIAQAKAELEKFAGVQFDPEVVDAFMKTSWAQESQDVDAGVPRPIALLGQVAPRNAAYDSPAPGSPAADLA